MIRCTFHRFQHAMDDLHRNTDAGHLQNPWYNDNQTGKFKLSLKLRAHTRLQLQMQPRMQ